MPTSSNITSTSGRAFAIPAFSQAVKVTNNSNAPIFWRLDQTVAVSGDSAGECLMPGATVWLRWPEKTQYSKAFNAIHSFSGNRTIQYDVYSDELVVESDAGNIDGGGIPVSWGIAGVRFSSADQSAAAAAVSDAPPAGLKLVATDIEISVDTAMKVTLSEETTGTVISEVYMGANTTVNLVTRGKRKLATAVKKLMVRTSASGNITVNAGYYFEP